MFRFKLAELLHKTVDELGDMSVNEFKHWKALFIIRAEDEESK